MRHGHKVSFQISDEHAIELAHEFRDALITIKDQGKRITKLEARVVRLEGYGGKKELQDGVWIDS